MPFFLEILKSQGRLENLALTIGAVGSRKSHAGDDFSRAARYFAPNLQVYGFDADPEACEAANQSLQEQGINWVEEHIPAALADSTGVKTLYVTLNPMCSSLFAPNEVFLRRFKNLPELAGLDFTVELETTTLDQLCQEVGIGGMDFLEIDVQGAELLVLRGATQLLNNHVLAIKTEVEFSPLYLEQPLFADIDGFLRQQGFLLWDIDKSYRPRAIAPISSALRPGQLLWGDAYYFRDLLSPDIAPSWVTPDNLLKLACLADLLEFTDYALELLTHLTLTYGQQKEYNFAAAILTSLEQIPDLTGDKLNSSPAGQKLKQFL